jgi:glycosyltransferase involved in cell wall biosynthesis
MERGAMPSIAVDARMIGASGIGVMLNSLLQRMIPLRPDWRFDLYGDAEKLAHLAAMHVTVRPFAAAVYSLGEQRLGLMLNRDRPDLAWSPHYNIPLLWRGRLLVTVHDLLHLARPEMFPGLVKQTYARSMFAQVRRRAAGTVFVSDFTEKEFRRLIGVPRGEGRVIYNGVDVLSFGDGGSSPHDRPYVLFVGNIKPHKNLRHLVEAFRMIADRVPHDLVLIGQRKGFITGEGDFETLIGGNPRILFTGAVPKAQLAAWYGNADALVMPSFYEGFGLPPLEAMAAGCPVMVANAASLPEVCGDAALYCDPFQTADIADKLLTLLTDEDLRKRLRIAGSVRAKSFDWDRAVQSYLAMIETLL